MVGLAERQRVQNAVRTGVAAPPIDGEAAHTDQTPHHNNLALWLTMMMILLAGDGGEQSINQ